MEDFYATLNIEACVSEDKLERCYDYLNERRLEIADYIVKHFGGTVESNLD